MRFLRYFLERPKLIPVYGRLAWEMYRTHGTKAVLRKARQFLTRQNRSVRYSEWVSDVEAIREKRAVRLLEEVKNGPKISLLMPVYNVDAVWLEKAIDSVRAQRYANWELCIADDHSDKPHVHQILQRYAGIEPRIKVVYRAE